MHITFIYRKIYKLECDEDGLWKGESCVPITCPPPDIVFKGLYRCTDRFNVDSTCTMICPDNPVCIYTTNPSFFQYIF